MKCDKCEVLEAALEAFGEQSSAFVALVAEVRAVQVAYFANRCRENLIRSKELERKLDARLKEINGK